MQIDTSMPVMVSGSTGYVAGQIVARLLEAGATVHAPVRDPSRGDKLEALNEIASRTPGTIRYFEADLMDPGSYAEGMAGCGVVLHTASPFVTSVKDPQRELVDPARLGTRNVLEEANRHETVRRVVLTSSCAAIYGDCVDVANAPGGVLTEEVWNTTSSLQHQPYSYSKTVAEQEAWKLVEAQSRWDLVVINPSLVIGPGVRAHAGSESYSIVRQMGDGSMKQGAPRFGIGVVDVRDLAEAHLAAAFLPNANGRNIISGHNTDLLQMAMTLLPRFGSEYPIPRKAMSKWLVWLLGPMIDKTLTRKVVQRNVDIAWNADNSKSIRELGITYRPMVESMNDMFAQMIAAGFFTKS